MWLVTVADDTHAAVMAKVAAKSVAAHAVNINGTPLYRPHSVFGADMRKVVGKSSMLL